MTNPYGNVTNGRPWFPEDVASLKQLWYVERKTMLQIADELGRSRSAVGGKINRITLKEKLERRGINNQPRTHRRISRPYDSNRRTTAVPKVKAPEIAPRFVSVDAPICMPAYDQGEGPVEYLKLRSHHCRALLEERGSDGLKLSCGKPKIVLDVGESSYCPKHHRLFVNPWARRHDGKVSEANT